MIRIAAAVAVLAMLAVGSAHAAATADPGLSVEANQAFLAANAKKPGVIVRPSGLQYRILKSGYGKQPKATDSVTVYYKGSLINGKVFDSTEPGMPSTFQTNQLIPGWTEALQLMREGDHWELVLPAQLAYGPRGAGDAIAPNQTLIFDLQLVSVNPPPPQPQGDDKSAGSGAY